MRNEIQSKTCDEKPKFAPDRQNCDTEIWIVGDVWKPQHSWKIWQSPGVSHQLLGKRTQCRHSASVSWLGRQVFFSKSEENFVKSKPRRKGTFKNSQIDLSRYCSKQLGAKKPPKVGHAALPSNLKPKLDQTAFWGKLDGGAHLSDVKAKNLPEENWTLCHKGVEAPCNDSRVILHLVFYLWRNVGEDWCSKPGVCKVTEHKGKHRGAEQHVSEKVTKNVSKAQKQSPNNQLTWEDARSAHSLVSPHCQTSWNSARF